MVTKDRRMIALAIGLMCSVWGFFNLIEPQAAPTGRWRIVLLPLYEAVGPRGVALLWIAVGVVFLFIAYSRRNED